jgi:nucleotide-binding universal stress UspA family protein
VPATVIVPLDGSDYALRAVGVGVLLARACEADLVLLTTPMSTADRGEPVWLPEAAADSGYERVRTEVYTSNDAIAAIADCVARTDDATLCMATHGRGALGTAILGSVAQRVVREHSVDTVFVGPNFDARWEVLGPLLVCHDGSARVNRIVPGARTWARVLGVDAIVVHVAHPLDVPAAGTPTAELGEALAFLDQRTPEAALRVVTDRHPPAGILALADDLSASVIALGTHGRTGDVRRTLGGVAGAVVHGAACPVLIPRRQDLIRTRP